VISGLATAAPASAVNNGLALTPPMGFNDWNSFGCNVSEALIEQTADLFVSEGLQAAGYQYVNIDDCWMTHERDQQTGRLVPDPAKFPNGIKGTADYVHAKGLKLGVYEDAGTLTCAGFPGSLGHERIDAQTFADWGVDYLKYDNCFNNSDGTLADFQARYRAMGDALAASGRSIAYSICEWGQLDPAKWAGDIGNLWRTTGDIGDNWASLKSIISANMGLAGAARPGAWNDPDMLEVGNGGMSTIEYQTHFGLWAEMAAPLLIGTDLRKASPTTLSILRNKDVIAVDQDPLGIQGRVLSNSGGLVVFDKPLANGDHAVALYNSTDAPATIGIAAGRTGLPRAHAYRMTDLWTGAATETAGVISAAVPAHGTAMYRVRPVRRPASLPPSTTLAASAASSVSGAPGINPVLLAGAPDQLLSTVTNQGIEAIEAVRLSVTAPAGWTVVPTTGTRARTLHTGQSLATAWTVTAPAGATPGTYDIVVTAGYRYGEREKPVVATNTVTVLLVAAPPHGASALSNLTWVASTNGWGPVEKDQSNGELGLGDGHPITIAGTVYPKGLGIQPNSSITYYLGGTCANLTTLVGIDDEKTSAQSAIFQVFVDGAKKADSGPVNHGEPAKSLSADLTGGTWLTLTALPNSPFGDHADWAGPLLTCG
jgi:alpha-galactosidase